MNSTKEHVISSIFFLQDECLSLAKELLVCLQNERKSLIALDTDKIIETNVQKENLSRVLKFKKKQIWNLVSAHFALENTEGLETKIEEPWKTKWLTKKNEWIKTWEETTNLCETNQMFLKHSLNNLHILSDHLKRLFGEQPLYTSKGVKAEKNNSGKVVQAQF